MTYQQLTRDRMLTSCQAAHDASPSNGCVHDRDDIAELRLKCGVKVSTALDSRKAVAVCEFGENADIAAVLEL